MTTKKIITYDSSDQDKFIHDPLEIDIQLDGAEFKLVDEQVTENQTYVTDEGITYNPLYAEFIGGNIKKKDQTLPTSMLGANFNSITEINWAKSSFTQIFTGAVVADAFGLNFLGGGNKNTIITSVSIGNAGEKGTIEFDYKPGYSLVPSGSYNIFSIRDPLGTNKDLIQCSHAATGDTIRFSVFNSAGSAVVSSFAFGASQNFTLGQVYKFALIWDWSGTNRVMRLYRNGALWYSHTTGTMVRGNAATQLYLGAGVTYANTDCQIAKCRISNAVMYISPYTPNYVIPAKIYAASTVIDPLITYDGPGIIKTVDSAINTGTNVPIVSTTFDDNSIQNQFDFDESNDQQIVSNTETIYTGDFYPEYSLIEPTEYSDAQGFENLEESLTVEGDATVNYICKIGYLYFYLSGGILITSDKTFSQSNTVNEWLAATAIVDALINIGVRLTFLPIPSSGTERKNNFKLVSTTLSYDFFPVPSGCSQCTLYGFLRDNCNPVKTARVTISTPKPIYTQGTVQAFEEDAEIELSNGSFEIPLVIPNLPVVENRTDDYYLLNATWTDMDDKEWSLVNVKIIIPNEPKALFNEDVIKKGR